MILVQQPARQTSRSRQKQKHVPPPKVTASWAAISVADSVFRVFTVIATPCPRQCRICCRMVVQQDKRHCLRECLSRADLGSDGW